MRRKKPPKLALARMFHARLLAAQTWHDDFAAHHRRFNRATAIIHCDCCRGNSIMFSSLEKRWRHGDWKAEDGGCRHRMSFSDQEDASYSGTTSRRVEYTRWLVEGWRGYLRLGGHKSIAQIVRRRKRDWNRGSGAWWLRRNDGRENFYVLLF